jgi:hypothetical protein
MFAGEVFGRSADEVVKAVEVAIRLGRKNPLQRPAEGGIRVGELQIDDVDLAGVQQQAVGNIVHGSPLITGRLVSHAVPCPFGTVLRCSIDRYIVSLGLSRGLPSKRETI